MKAFSARQVAAVFRSYPVDARRKLLALRGLIFRVASITSGVGKIEETLKWGEPAYLTTQSGSGSTIRIAAVRADPACYAMHFNCQTTLVQTFRTRFPRSLCYEANRSIVFRVSDRIPVNDLSACISMALTYHRDRKPATPPRARSAARSGFPRALPGNAARAGRSPKTGR